MTIVCSNGVNASGTARGGGLGEGLAVREAPGGSRPGPTGEGTTALVAPRPEDADAIPEIVQESVGYRPKTEGWGEVVPL